MLSECLHRKKFQLPAPVQQAGTRPLLDYSIEHIVPKKKAEVSSLPSLKNSVHDLGNLTLLSQKGNSQLSHDGIDIKQRKQIFSSQEAMNFELTLTVRNHFNVQEEQLVERLDNRTAELTSKIVDWCGKHVANYECSSSGRPKTGQKRKRYQASPDQGKQDLFAKKRKGKQKIARCLCDGCKVCGEKCSNEADKRDCCSSCSPFASVQTAMGAMLSEAKTTASCVPDIDCVEYDCRTLPQAA